MQSRLDRLDAADKRALQAAAVIGQRFEPAVLRHLLDDAAYDITVAARGATSCATKATAHHYAFAHALIRDGTYASLLHSARRALHLRAAEWFALARRGARGRAPGPGRRRRCRLAYLAAARAEAAALRFDSALRLVRRGAQLPSTGDVAHALAQFEGDLARDTGDLSASLAAFERAAEHATEDRERCAALIGIAAAHRATGATAPGLAVLACWSRSPRRRAPREVSRGAYLRGCLEFARGDATASRAAQEAALTRAQEANDAACEAHALSGLADVLYADGRMASAYAAFERCVALCDREGLARFALNNRAMLAVVHAYLAPLDGALHVLDRVRADARELRHRAAEVMADESEAWVRVSQGMFEAAIVPAERSLALARDIGSRRFVLIDQGLLAYAYWHTGRRDHAALALAEALDIARDIGMRFVGGILLGARALMVRDASELAALVSEAERVLAAGAPAHNHFAFRGEAIDASLAHGDIQGALRQAALHRGLCQRGAVADGRPHGGARPCARRCRRRSRRSRGPRKPARARTRVALAEARAGAGGGHRRGLTRHAAPPVAGDHRTMRRRPPCSRIGGARV